MFFVKNRQDCYQFVIDYNMELWYTKLKNREVQ